MNGRGEADSPGRGRAHYTPLGSTSGPHHNRVETVSAALHFHLTSAASPAPAGWEVEKHRRPRLAQTPVRQRLFLTH